MSTGMMFWGEVRWKLLNDATPEINKRSTTAINNLRYPTARGTCDARLIV